ncbi:MAG: hypothetical protein OXR73_06935 [Myxococcales bacterium]|nr:hypothetical protein [Myxococcales bacterium]
MNPNVAYTDGVMSSCIHHSPLGGSARQPVACAPAHVSVSANGHAGMHREVAACLWTCNADLTLFAARTTSIKGAPG